MTTEHKNYLSAETSFINLFGLKIGQRVKVLRKAKDREAGWANSWNSNMTPKIGKELTVEKFSSEGYGVRCTDGYYYPFYCLEVIPVKDTSIKLNSGSYTAVINGSTGVVKVGCQVISPETVKAIYEASQSALKSIVPAKKKVAAKKTAKKVAAKKTAR